MEKIAFQPKTLENTELKENILKKLKRLALMGITVSTLLMNACKSESGSNEKDKNDFDVHTLKAKIDNAKTAELNKIDIDLTNLGIEFFNELKNHNLLEVNKERTLPDDTVFFYKNWSFKSPVKDFNKVDTKGVEVSWKSDEKNEDGTVKEGYSYMVGYNDKTDEPSGTVIHYSHPNLQAEGYDEYWNSGSGEVWRTMMDKKNPDLVLAESEIDNVYGNASHAFKELEIKLQKEVDAYDSPRPHHIRQDDLDIHQISNPVDPEKEITPKEQIPPHKTI